MSTIKTCNEFSMTPTVDATAATAGYQPGVSSGTMAGRAAAGEAHNGRQEAIQAPIAKKGCPTCYDLTRVNPFWQVGKKNHHKSCLIWQPLRREIVGDCGR